MPDFTLMRQNMVKGQVLPENVTNPDLLEAFLNIPREKFVPRQLSHVAYMDANFPLTGNRFLLRPATLALLLETLNSKPSDSILYIASGTGYGPAVLGYMGVRVIALDSDENLTQDAERYIEDLNLSSVRVVLGDLKEGWESEAPYDKIMIEGCVDGIPDFLLKQVKEEGIVVTVKHHKAMGMKAVKFIKSEDSMTEIPLFDAFAPRLDAFCKHASFIF